MRKYGKMRSEICHDVTEHSAEWVVSKELIKANERLTIICTVCNVVWALTVFVLILIR